MKPRWDARRLLALGGLLLLASILVQGAHMAEHVAQVAQKFALGQAHAHGLAGEVFDREPVHLAYNLALFVGLVAVGVLLGFRDALARRQHWAPWFAAALALQTYHLGEHVVKIHQFVSTGLDDRPGVLGQFVQPILLHFGFNLAVLALMVASYAQWRRHRPYLERLALMRRSVAAQRPVV